MAQTVCESQERVGREFDLPHALKNHGYPISQIWSHFPNLTSWSREGPRLTFLCQPGPFLSDLRPLPMARVPKTRESKVRFLKSKKITFFGFCVFFWVLPIGTRCALLQFCVKNIFTCSMIFLEFCRGWHKNIFDLSAFLFFCTRTVFRKPNENCVWF